MSEYYHIVPWYNSDEWHNVYDKLYSQSSSLTSKQHALELLTIWKVRCPSLPSGVESTLTLLEVYIQDVTNCIDAANDQILRLAYSSAIMRFVNHMLDSEIAKGVSLYQAAKSLGVPDWIVDLRHDTAHNNKLPSIELLREASLFGLQWLKAYYWDKYKECIIDYVSGYKDINVAYNEKISNLMNLCMFLSFCANTKTEKLQNIPPSMRESILSETKELLGNKIDISKFKSVSALIDVINVYTKNVLKYKNCATQINEILLGDDSVILSLEVVEYLSNKEFKNKMLNEHYVQCFQTFLSILHSNDLLLDFVLELIKVTQTCDNSDKATLAALWVSKILIGLRQIKRFEEKMKTVASDDMRSKQLEQLKMHYYHWFPNEKMKPLLLDLHNPVPDELMDINFIQPIIATYNPYLTYFIKDLLNLIVPRLSTQVTKRICELAKLISSPNKFPVLDSKIYTVDDIKLETKDYIEINQCDSDSDCLEVFNELQTDKEEESIEGIKMGEIHKGSIWKLSSNEHNWSHCPIGQLPWQQNNVGQNKY